ncbi:MAG: archaemetzincin family Zn-dependent metalloprotease [Desulfomonile tiedjei]|nr:archaemetzincin family Zn-dependent metalloprotease [Desulfomonile tiedjei]
MIEHEKKPEPRTPGKAIIAVLPLGRVREDILRVVADGLQGILRLPVDLRDPIAVPEDAFMESRNQYNAMALIKYLDRELSHNSLKILGITANDICNPILTYVFGEAYMGGRSAVMSSARLKAGLLGEPVSREQFLDRVVKVAIHEIGHTFNLRHCHTDRCVMRASNTLLELDEKLNYLCDYCEIFLFDSLREALKDPEVADGSV